MGDPPKPRSWRLTSNETKKLGLVDHASNHNTREAEAGELLPVPSLSGLQRETLPCHPQNKGVEKFLGPQSCQYASGLSMALNSHPHLDHRPRPAHLYQIL